MTPQELRSSILQLAIQGRLVEQRPEEGTGQELLDTAIVSDYVKGRKVKQKIITDISENEIECVRLVAIKLSDLACQIEKELSSLVNNLSKP